MNAIVSVTENWGIGHEGKLIVRNRADMQRFVSLTMGGTVLMGRTTFESFPSGPLKGRHNVVLTTDRAYADTHPGITCVHSIDEALAGVADDEPDAVWLIGGAQLYHELLDHCDRCYVTRNHTVVPADTFFPNLDEHPSWELERVEDGGITAGGIAFDFVTYHNRART